MWMPTEASSHGQAAATGGAHDEQERQADRRAGEIDHRQPQKRIAAMLDQRVPGGVQGRGTEHDGEDER